jgi:ABC-type Fe3+ transport system substrate-binding protein
MLYVFRGEDYVRELLTKQDVTVTGDNRQLVDWVVRGRYPIGVGLTGDVLRQFQAEGLGGNVRTLDEGPKALSPGFGGIQLLNRPPDPNAAKLFVNWLLSREAQTRISETVGVNSRRVDVPVADPTSAPDPARLHEYVRHQDEDLLPQRERTQELALELVH